MKRFARAALVALLILFMAVTPLSALIAPGEFEVRFRPDGFSNHWFEPTGLGFTVRLRDRTGLARGLAVAVQPRGVYDDGVTNHGVEGRMLLVHWEGSSCDVLTYLTFERDVNGYLIRERTNDSSCVMGTGMSHTVAIQLWAPVDASNVRFIADGER